LADETAARSEILGLCPRWAAWGGKIGGVNRSKSLTIPAIESNNRQKKPNIDRDLVALLEASERG
jgi:hypothetical protein